LFAPLSQIARRMKLDYFFAHLEKDARILEVGCADGWVGDYATEHGWSNFVGIDIERSDRAVPHEFIHGDINEWRSLGLRPESFDAIIAFEVIEHGDFLAAMSDLLRPGGKLLVTTPLPSRDWLCKLLERLGLNQRRTSPHTHLIYLDDLPRQFRPLETFIKARISQWGVFEKIAVPTGWLPTTESSV
jgi:cyclopropane fatty-acyl-phospholipid synthase-like methyltransferase